MTTKSKRRKASSAWLQDHIHDPYVKLAQKEGYRARAAYKLKEIDEALRLIRPGTRVVDLGAAPGAWSQYLARRLAEPGAQGGLLIGLDMLPMEPVPGMQFLQGDFREEAVLLQLEEALGGQPVDLVVSDMAPNLSGIESSDAARMADLAELAVHFSLRHLKPDGALVCKVFHGSGYSQLVHLFKQSFRVAKAIKPRASRDRSSETYLVGMGPKA